MNLFCVFLIIIFPSIGLTALNCWFHCNIESQEWAGTVETAFENTYLRTSNCKCILKKQRNAGKFFLFIYILPLHRVIIYDLWRRWSERRRRARMMRLQWLIVAPRVLRQMELLSLLLSHELTSFLKLLLHISVGNGLPNFPTPSPCISYVHINESSGGFWTRRRAGGLLYGQQMQVERWRFYWTFSAVGQQKKQKKHTFPDFHSPGFKLVCVYVLAFEKCSIYLKIKKQT